MQRRPSFDACYWALALKEGPISPTTQPSGQWFSGQPELGRAALPASAEQPQAPAPSSSITHLPCTRHEGGSQHITDNSSIEDGNIPYHRCALHLCHRLQLRLISAGCSAVVHAAAAIALTLAPLDWKHLARHEFEAAPLANRAKSLHLLAGSIGRIASSTSPCRVLLRQSPSCPQPHLECC